MSEFTLVLDYEDPDEDPDDTHEPDMGCGDSEHFCPICKSVFKGKIERGRKRWLSFHIRLHGVQAGRERLCPKEDLLFDTDVLVQRALQQLVAEKSELHLKHDTMEITEELLKKPLHDLFICVDRIADCVCLCKPVFLREELVPMLEAFLKVLFDCGFRQQCISVIRSLLDCERNYSMFFSSFLSRLRDECCMYRLRKMRERLPLGKVNHTADREEIIMYVGGWVLRRCRRECWRRHNIKKETHAKRFQCLMDYFVEGGECAEAVPAGPARCWIDKRNRGHMTTSGKMNGLMVPSKVAFSFFCLLDGIMESFECDTGLRRNLTFEAVLDEVYNNIQMLDLWNALTAPLQ